MLSRYLKAIIGMLSKGSPTAPHPVEPASSYVGPSEIEGQNIQPFMLEKLPSELKSQILLDMSDLQTLNALIHASPSYHQVYTSQRINILSKVMERELEPPVLADAIATLAASRLADGEDRITKVRDFLDQYRTTIYAKGGSGLSSITPEDISCVARLHTAITTIALRFYEFTVVARPHLPDVESTRPSPSRTELQRIYRALYRFEMFCKLFSSNRIPRDSTRYFQTGYPYTGATSSAPLNLTEADGRDISDWFLAIFQPWEVEEIGCVYDFLSRQYDTLFKQVAEHPSKYQANYRFMDDFNSEDESHCSKQDISEEGKSAFFCLLIKGEKSELADRALQGCTEMNT
jgi:hypothetical protein